MYKLSDQTLLKVRDDANARLTRRQFEDLLIKQGVYSLATLRDDWAELSKTELIELTLRSHKYREVVDALRLRGFLKSETKAALEQEGSEHEVATPTTKSSKRKASKKKTPKRRIRRVKRKSTQDISDIDVTIIARLKRFSLSTANSYHQSIVDLQSAKRYSWRGAALELREAYRETLHHLAPDERMIAQPNFRGENNGSPTQAQRVKYILETRDASDKATQLAINASDTIESLSKAARLVYDRSSASVHAPTSKKEVLSLRRWVQTILCELLDINK